MRFTIEERDQRTREALERLTSASRTIAIAVCRDLMDLGVEPDAARQRVEQALASLGAVVAVDPHDTTAISWQAIRDRRGLLTPTALARIVQLAGEAYRGDDAAGSIVVRFTHDTYTRAAAIELCELVVRTQPTRGFARYVASALHLWWN